MPKRWCIEPGCGQLYDAALTGTRRCPPCQAAADQRATARRARATAGRPSATRRGYGTTYQRRRDTLVAQATRDHAPCHLCGQPCLPGQDIVAHHPDGSPATADPATCRLEPAHAACNSGHRPPR